MTDEKLIQAQELSARIKRLEGIVSGSKHMVKILSIGDDRNNPFVLCPNTVAESIALDSIRQALEILLARYKDTFAKL